MKSPLDNAFGQSLSAWVARVTEQIKEIDRKLDQQKIATIETNQDLEAFKKAIAEDFEAMREHTREFRTNLAEKMAYLTAKTIETENNVKELQGNRNYLVGAVLLSVLGAILSLVLVQKK